jgi:small subunit ribosomal protein S24e
MTQLDIKITSERNNPLLERREVEFVISYERAAPPRKEVIAKLAANMNAKEDLVVVEKMKNEFGTHAMVGRAKIYSKAENLKAIEYDYILERGKTGKGKADKKDDKKATGKEADAWKEKSASMKAGKEKGADKKAEKSGDGETQTADTGGDEPKAE